MPRRPLTEDLHYSNVGGALRLDRAGSESEGRAFAERGTGLSTGIIILEISR